MLINYVKLVKISRYARKYSTAAIDTFEDFKRIDQDCINPVFLSRLLGISHFQTSKILKTHKELLTVNQKDALNTAKLLTSYNFSLTDIPTKPMILYVNALTIQNRFEILTESGFFKIPIGILLKYITVQNKNIEMLKAHGFILEDTIVQQKLIDTFSDAHIVFDTTISEKMPLKLLRELILNRYLSNKLEMSEKDIKNLWSKYSRIRHKSFRSVLKMLNILLKDLNFSKDRIIKNGYLLHGDPENVQRMLESFPTVGGEDIKEIFYRRPKIIMSTYENLSEILAHLKTFEIPETAIKRCTEILTLSSNTVLERLNDLNEIEEFKVLNSNPRVLRLVHYQNKARARLDYLSQLKVRCASLHILSCSSESFAKFAREGSDRSKGRDVVCFLADKLNKNPVDVRNMFLRHPNWCHIPLIQAKGCYDFLISKKFQPDDIYNNMHILLYSITRIDEKLKLLQNKEIYEEYKLDMNYTQVSNSQLLAFVLYLLEAEYHFTGDGIWTDFQMQPIENFNNLLVDFPENFGKDCKLEGEGVSSNMSQS